MCLPGDDDALDDDDQVSNNELIRSATMFAQYPQHTFGELGYCHHCSLVAVWHTETDTHTHSERELCAMLAYCSGEPILCSFSNWLKSRW